MAVRRLFIYILLILSVWKPICVFPHEHPSQVLMTSSCAQCGESTELHQLIDHFLRAVMLISRRIMTELVEASSLLFFLFSNAAALPTQQWLSHFVIFCGKSLAPVMWACASFNTKRLPAGQFVSGTPQRSRAAARIWWHGASRLQNGIDSDGMWPVNCPPWSAAGKWISV